MFFPLSDDNPIRAIRFQYVTVLLIVLNVAIFGLQLVDTADVYAASFAVVPSELWKVGLLGGPAFGPGDALAVPERYTLLSYMFLHGDPMHLFSNMIFLWVFGDNIEDAMGHVKFLVFYVACGVAAGLVHTLVLPTSGVPLIGASGAVAGIIAAYVILYPQVRVWVLALRVIPLRVTAAFALGAWIVMQVAMLFLPTTGPIAWWAHIGGLAAGAVLVVFLRRPDVPLFGRKPASA